MISLGVRYVKYPEIASVAASFLREKQLTSIPIDIEWVIESVYKTNIIPIPGLQEWFETEGFSTPDFRSISVDEYVWKNCENRYRFTLAHELGHQLMHRQYLDRLREYSSVTEWVEVVGQIDPEDHHRMEHQAYSFAGFLLVPPNHLKSEFTASLRSLDSELEQVRHNGLTRCDYLQCVSDQLAYKLSPRFQVSSGVMTRRIQYDGLNELIP